MTADMISGRLGGDKFLAQVLGREHRRYPAGEDEREAFADLLTWSALNNLLATQRLDPPRMRLAAGGAIDAGEYTRLREYRRMPDWNQPVPHLFQQQLRDGATLILDAIDEMHPPIGRLIAELEAWLSTGIQVNAYASWTSKEGFGVHWDDHDVLVLQVSGRKRWRIYGNTRVAPLHNDIEFAEEEPTEIIDEFVMEPGDILHVPRGCWHAVAASEGEPSLHLTCGLVTTTGVNFLRWMVNTLVEHEEIRADVPRTPAEYASWTRRISELVADRLHSPEVVEEYWRHQDETAPARPAFSLPVGVTGELTLSSVVRFASLRGTVTENDNEVVYSAQGRRWRLPTKVTPVVTHMHHNGPTSVEELHELVPDVSEQALLSLLRRLMDDGALVWEGET
ncbi:cupin superfamily protein [Haloactinospora alba]|uniref:Cupin superfamily protein n=1 Tax=Haloactinospora alba TaxID=405555 RepID=A0A543N7H8_9ACTN|nr:cupin domain-containing protein [Haloactinospora alba]TQN27768.1 cupin superfamily protein [Haloactinospora alba]